MQFLPNGGNYPGLKEVKVQIPKGWKVFYTRNGTTPNKKSSQVKKSISINGDEALYFAIYKKNSDSIIYKSNTYITSRKQTLPYFSIVTAPDNLFDSVKGIYVKGCCASEKPPYKGANFWKNIEKPIHIELIDKNKQVINQVAGIKIFGGYSKSMPQKSFAIYARKKYGKNRFYYPLFPQLPFNKYKNFILRNAGGDMQGAHIRDPFSSQLTKQWGIAFQEYQPVAVYINGKYWGIYSLREKINEHYIHQHFDIKKSDISILSPPEDIKYGTRNTLKDYQNLIHFLKQREILTNKDFKQLQKMIDVEDYLKYSIIQIYLGNSDASANIRLYKDAQKNTPYKTILYDLDMGLAIFDRKKIKENSLALFTSDLDTNKQYPTDYTLILRKLLTNDSIKNVFVNYFSDAIQTFFLPEHAQLLLDKMTKRWSEEIGYHRKRWNVKELRYERSIDRIKTFLKRRPVIIQKQLSQKFDLKEQFNLRVGHNKGGKIKLNSIFITNDYNAKYYKGIPLTVEAIPNDNFYFAGWKHNKSKNTKQTFTVQKENYSIEPIFKPKKTPPYLNKVIVSEFKISHVNTRFSADWIELLNTSNDTLNISNWTLKDEKEQHVFTLKEGTLLLPKSYLVLTTDKVKFKKEFGMFIHVVGNLPFGFNKNDKIRLYDDKGYRLVNIELSSFPPLKSKKLSWVRQGIGLDSDELQQWIQAKPTPGDNRLFFSQKNEYDKSRFLIHTTVFYGIILVLLIFIVIFYYFGKRLDI